MTINRLSIIALCVSAGLAVGVMITATSVRTRDLERLQGRDDKQLAELAVLHRAICDLRTGYTERHALLNRPLPSGPTRDLVVALKGSFAETLYALRTLDCNGGAQP